MDNKPASVLGQPTTLDVNLRFFKFTFYRIAGDCHCQRADVSIPLTTPRESPSFLLHILTEFGVLVAMHSVLDADPNNATWCSTTTPIHLRGWTVRLILTSHWRKTAATKQINIPIVSDSAQRYLTHAPHSSWLH